MEYWKVDNPEDFVLDKFPTFIFRSGYEKHHCFYGFPVYEYPGLLKVSLSKARFIAIFHL